MKHPTIARDAALGIAAERLASLSRAGGEASAGRTRVDDLSADLGDSVKWWGEAPDLDLEPFEEAHHELRTLVDGHDPRASDPDQVEGRAACALFRAIDRAGPEPAALDDPGFWRYIGLAYTWDFTVWREHKAFEARESEDGATGSNDSFRPYIDALNSRMCVPTRMYLRVKALGGLQHETLAWSVRDGTDFWRSHILRVKAGEHPQIVRAMVRRQATEATRLTTGPLRRFAKDLNRTLTNLVPSLLDDEDADALVGELWQRSGR